jgi:hypothetical protein
MPWTPFPDLPPEAQRRARAQMSSAVFRINDETVHCGVCLTDLHEGETCRCVAYVLGELVSVNGGMGPVLVFDRIGGNGRYL